MTNLGRAAVLALFFPALGWGAVTRDAVTLEQSTLNETLTFSHTCNCDYLLVGAHIVTSVDSISGATYNGVAMTLISSATSPSTVDKAYLFGLANPARGANNVVVTCNGSSGALRASAMSFRGVHQTSPTGSRASLTGTSAALSMALTSLLNGMAVDYGFVGGTGTPATAASGQSAIDFDDPGSTASSSKAAAGSTTSMTWTLGGSTDWAHLGVMLAPADGGGQHAFSGRREGGVKARQKRRAIFS